MAYAGNQGLFVAMVAMNLQVGLANVGVAVVVLFSGGSGGPKPPSSASGKS